MSKTTHFPNLTSGGGLPPPPSRWAQNVIRPGDPRFIDLVSFPRLTKVVASFLRWQYCPLDKQGVPRLLMVLGTPGTGKTVSLIGIALAQGKAVLIVAASDLTSEYENGATQILREILEFAEHWSRENKQPIVVMINDLHLSTMAATDDKTVGKTVNGPLLVDAMMQLADFRQHYRNADGSAIAFLITLNDASKLPEPLKRDGRCSRYVHVPTRDELSAIAWSVLQPRTSAEGALVDAVFKKCARQSAAFWHALRLEIGEEAFQSRLAETRPTPEALARIYSERVPLRPELVWPAVKRLRSSRINTWLAKRGWRLDF